MSLQNKDVIKLMNDNGVSLSVNNTWGARTISGTVTMGGECLDELLKAINDSESYNIKVKTGEDVVITLNNVKFKSDVSNGEGDYMIYPITAQGVSVKEPERIKDIKDQMMEIP